MAAFGASLLLEEGGLQESSSRAARAAGAAPGADRARASKTVATNAALGCAAVASAGLLLGWVCLGRILTLHNVVRGKTLAGLAWLSGCCLYVGTVTSCCTGCGTGGWQDELGKQVGIMQSGRQQGSQTLADLMAAFTVGVVAAEAAGRWALSGHYTRGRWVSPNLAPVLVVCIFAALCSVKQSFVKAGAADSDSQDWQCTYWALRAVNLPSALLGLVALVALWSSSAWLPITYDRQLVAERLLVDSRCGGSGAHNCTRISHSCSSLLPYQQTVLAGLGTMEAGPTKPPQKGEADTDTAPVIVLIHGLGSGSGHFCEQMVELSENHRLLCVEWRGCGRSNRAKFTPKKLRRDARVVPACVRRVVRGGRSARKARDFGRPLDGLDHSERVLLAVPAADRRVGTSESCGLAGREGSRASKRQLQPAGGNADPVELGSDTVRVSPAAWTARKADHQGGHVLAALRDQL